MLTYVMLLFTLRYSQRNSSFIQRWNSHLRTRPMDSTATSDQIDLWIERSVKMRLDDHKFKLEINYPFAWHVNYCRFSFVAHFAKCARFTSTLTIELTSCIVFVSLRRIEWQLIARRWVWLRVFFPPNEYFDAIVNWPASKRTCVSYKFSFCTKIFRAHFLVWSNYGPEKSSIAQQQHWHFHK